MERKTNRILLLLHRSISTLHRLDGIASRPRVKVALNGESHSRLESAGVRGPFSSGSKLYLLPQNPRTSESVNSHVAMEPAKCRLLPFETMRDVKEVRLDKAHKKFYPVGQGLSTLTVVVSIRAQWNLRPFATAIRALDMVPRLL